MWRSHGSVFIFPRKLQDAKVILWQWQAGRDWKIYWIKRLIKIQKCTSQFRSLGDFCNLIFFFCSILWLGVAIGGGGWVVTVHWCEWGNAIKQRATGYTSPKPLCGKCGLEALYRYPLVTIRISVAKLCSKQYKKWFNMWSIANVMQRCRQG